MDRLLYLLPAVGCAVMMGGMMWMMMRGNHQSPAQQPDDTAAELAALRAEVAALRADRDNPAGMRGPA